MNLINWILFIFGFHYRKPVYRIRRKGFLKWFAFYKVLNVSKQIKRVGKKSKRRSRKSFKLL